MKLWKLLVGLFFLLVILDGALRKWVAPGLSSVLFVLKDAVLWGGLILYANTRPVRLPRPLQGTVIPVLVGAYIFIVSLQAFNLRLPSLIVGAIGAKAHLAYLPLLVLIPAILAEATKQHVERLLWRYILFVFLPIAALSVYQYFMPATHWVNQYVREMGTIAMASGHVRVTGTFSYVGGFDIFLTFNAFLSVGVLLAGLYGRDQALRRIGLALAGITAIVMPMTGSRSSVFISAAGIALLVLVVASRRGHMLRIALGGLVIVGGIVLVANVTGLGKGWTSLAERTEEAGGRNQDRIVSAIRSPFRGLSLAGPVGFGAGSTHQAAPRFISGTSSHTWLPEGFIESGKARVIIELGLIGYFVLMAMKGALLYTAYQALQRSATSVELIVSATAFCMLLAYLIQTVIFNVVTSAFYWGTAGAVLGIWSLQQVRQNARQAMRRQTPAGGGA
jgi:hypothetical protein